MSNSKYTLDIISHHKNFRNKPLRKYGVDGIDTVGAWGDEPFEIIFKNNTFNKVQVKLSIDGTDIMTGDLASTDADGKMWQVNPFSTLAIKAWPETNNGGARFVFTSGTNGVAVNTHGDTSNRGIIAAAVYVEGHVQPTIYNTYYSSYYTDGRIGGRRRLDNYFTCDSTTKGSTRSVNSIDLDTKSNSYDCLCENETAVSASVTPTQENLKSLPAVGAGEYVNQKISYTTGFVKPVFTEAVRVRYLWWDELKSKLGSVSYPAEQPSGFPKDSKNIDLGATPRIKTSAGAFQRSEAVEYSRV